MVSNCFANIYMEKETPNGHSVGETLGASCILLSKGNGTLSGLDIQIRERKPTNSVKC